MSNHGCPWVVLTHYLHSSWRPSRVLVVSLALLGCKVVDPALAQDPLNGGFERPSDVQPERPFAWRVSGSGYTVLRTCGSREVPVPVANGYCSLHLAKPATGGLSQEQRTSIYVLRELSAAGIAGKRAELTLKVRATPSDAAQFHAWIRVSDAGGSYSDSLSLTPTPAPAMNGWRQLRAEGAVRKDAARLWIVLQYSGTSEAWIDDVQLRAANVAYDSILVALAPSASDESALARYAAPLRTSDPTGPDADMARVAEMIGSAPVVAIGEGTHGTHEFFQLRHRLVRYLVEHKGFTALALEANMAQTRAVNEYIHTGKGDPARMTSALGFWTWNTDETMAMIEWMRAFNQSGRGQVDVYGFDTQALGDAVDSVTAFIRSVAPTRAPALARQYDVIASIQARATSPWDPIDLPSATAFVAAARGGESIVDSVIRVDERSPRARWARQYANMIHQAGLQRVGILSGHDVRDSLMALNVKWIRETIKPGGRIALGAHHFHVQRDERTFGTYLGGLFGRDAVRIVGTATYEGSYLAQTSGIRPYRAIHAPPGSIEDMLNRMRMPVSAFDARAASRDPRAKWLNALHEFRQIGTSPREPGFESVRLADRFDIVLFVAHSTAAKTRENAPAVNR